MSVRSEEKVKGTEEMFNVLFGRAQGPAAFGIYLCLIKGDKLPKAQFAGVRVEEVRDIMRTLRLE